jgi:hypothetical protein
MCGIEKTEGTPLCRRDTRISHLLGPNEELNHLWRPNNSPAKGAVRCAPAADPPIRPLRARVEGRPCYVRPREPLLQGYPRFDPGSFIRGSVQARTIDDFHSAQIDQRLS